MAESAARIADYYRQRGLGGVGTSAGDVDRPGRHSRRWRASPSGFRQGFRFLSLAVLGLGLVVAISLTHAARDLRAPPGAGYS